MFTLQQLADQVGGTMEGPGALEITGVAPFETAGQGEITLAAGPAFLRNPEKTGASALIIPTKAEIRTGDKALLRVAQPKVAFAHILRLFHETPFVARGISSLAVVGRGCVIAPEVTIDPFVRLGAGVVIEAGVTLHSGVSVGDECRIGEGTVIYPNVTLYRKTIIGRRVIIHSGTVIGADGFGYVHDGKHQVKVPQTGHVEIGDEVEIGANCCIDRATFGATVIEDHVKLDNLVHVAHNCRIGRNTVIVGCCGISGSVRIGENCVLAGQVGVADHVTIGDGVTVLARAAVFKDVPSGSRVSGTPARDHREELRNQALLRRLPELLAKREIK